jgi:hypothetical protein
MNDFSKTFVAYDGDHTIKATIRYDDRGRNGHQTFSITGSTHDTCGCIHETIAAFFPHLAKYIKWHLFSSDGPLHYVANTVFLAGDQDCWGGRKGEVRDYRYNVIVNGGLVFECEPYCLPDEEEANLIAKRIGGEVVPVPWLLHEGKERNLDAARHTAVWLDATDEDLTAPGLEARLKARLPKLLEEFNSDMKELYEISIVHEETRNIHAMTGRVV